MGDCGCSDGTGQHRPQRRACPGCGVERRSVDHKTLLHQLRWPWRLDLSAPGYYFCDGSDCEVVYFAEDGTTLPIDTLRGEVGQKRREGDAPLCYCFDISYAAASADPTLQRFVIEQTESRQCSCDSRNPSGQCCLKDFKHK